jgi:hypothetical protein
LLGVSAPMEFMIDQGQEFAGGGWPFRFVDLPQQPT